MSAAILRPGAAGAGQFRFRMIAGIGVELLFQSARGQTQGLPPGRHLHGFKIQISDRPGT